MCLPDYSLQPLKLRCSDPNCNAKSHHFFGRRISLKFVATSEKMMRFTNKIHILINFVSLYLYVQIACYSHHDNEALTKEKIAHKLLLFYE